MSANVFALQEQGRSISFADDVKPNSVSAPTGSHKRRVVSKPKAKSNEEDDEAPTVSIHDFWI